MRLFVWLAACAVFPCIFALSPPHIACQLKKPSGLSPLAGCAPGTLFVSGNDPRADFQSVQEAITSLPERGPATILIGAGEYHETVNITRQDPVTLLGQLDPGTAFTPAGNASTRNLVHIWNNQFVVNGMDDAQSAVLLVAPSFNASLIGAGPTGAPLQPLFGNVDFKAYNIDFENRAANFSISQALVTDISYANASFYGCTFASYQDTWYTGRNASTYVMDSIIYGQTDYLFGFGTAWFEKVTLANRACGGGIAAWKGTNLTDAPDNRYGAYISNSRIIRSPDANATAVTDGKCFLGRPWNDLATTVYLRTFMDDSVEAVGWTPFDSARPVIMNTTFYAEYHSYGPGGNTSARIPLEHVLTDEEARAFTVDKVFLGWPQWIDYEYVS
ncbi:carbohydrate esterase family 8 protein [Trametes versicolor FP-101664 SS1]|uniref:carbohydrate esterase family 8 protein n=1 Tax=Trametes versicolor (strain FP-101664) TaxID=717944 RepID=UPI00046244B8|nr:carbohydrate esterase family 8 protein [Trametes versicolor FP-101664 SS1]EIW52368.1 carbohydrate esterase family 8 protein [Trametes versicolor FP-101664 SS1]